MAQPTAPQYIPPPTMADMGTNPYTGLAQTAGQNYGQSIGALATIPDAMMGLQNQQQAMQAYGASNAPTPDGSQYPSFANPAGLGSGTPFGSSPQPQQSAGDPGTSRGFNPWSLQGEALSR